MQFVRKMDVHAHRWCVPVVGEGGVRGGDHGIGRLAVVEFSV